MHSVICRILRILPVCCLFGLLAALYWFAIRPGQLHWGATDEEIHAALPMDGIVAHPVFDATRAITINAPPRDIWPWLVQMGYGRAGFYGYDLIENPGGGRGLRSAGAILQQLQRPLRGQALPLSMAASLEFGLVDPDRALVWMGRENPPRGVFVWALRPIDATHTRLVSRIRWQYGDDAVGRALGVFTEFADHVAVRAILHGVRDRVEGRRPESLAIEGLEIGGWALLFLELAAAVAAVLLIRRWPVAWLVALGAGLALQFVLYGPGPAWVNVLLPWMYTAGAVVLLRGVRRAAQVPTAEHA